MYVYCLLLQNSKYYVGSSQNVKRRFLEHLRGKGALWTIKYPPVKILESFPGDTFTEDATTKRYMSKYGIENVRGGSYVQIHFENSIKLLLEREIAMATGRCYLCKQVGHFGSDCPTRKTL